MVTLQPLCFCTNCMPADALEPALDLAARCGFSRVELSAIDGINEQISAEQVSPEYAAAVRRALESRGLTCYALSGHCDLTDEKSLERLLRKIEFLMVSVLVPQERAPPFWAPESAIVTFSSVK